MVNATQHWLQLLRFRYTYIWPKNAMQTFACGKMIHFIVFLAYVDLQTQALKSNYLQFDFT
jgi:hypothetical protein